MPVNFSSLITEISSRRCPTKYRHGKRNPQYFCPHIKDEERGYTATLCSLELKEALAAGYRITKIYRAYIWDNKDMDDDLFKEYMRKFLKLKYISSGWPSEIKKMKGAEQVRAQREYCRIAKDKFGIEFRPCDINSNPGLKFLAKQMLNCNFIHI